MSLTENELVIYLNQAGKAVTRRRVMTWREKGLLPDFDVRGRGQGRGPGRACSYWNNAERIISQASTIFELLHWRDRVEEAFLPLWLLGYPIPEVIVRRKLREEIVSALELLAEKDACYESREDVLFAMAAALYGKWRRRYRSDAPPLESIDLVLQLIGNLFYVSDDPLSSNLQFVREYLSLAALDNALQGVTSEELSQLQRDFGVVTDMISQVFSAMPRFTANFTNKYGLLTLAGQLSVMFDLAFRRAGYGPNIDNYLSVASMAVRDNLHKLQRAYAVDNVVKEV